MYMSVQVSKEAIGVGSPPNWNYRQLGVTGQVLGA